MICEVCRKRPAMGSAIIRELYYKSICRFCKESMLTSQVSSGQAVYNRSRDLEDHEADVIQPYEAGKPSAEFIHLYPKQAKRMMTPEEIDRATRS